MTLKYTVDSLDGIPEEHHGLYQEADGKYRLNVDGVEDVTGLKKTVEATRAERDAAKQAAKEYAERMKQFEGIDPEQVRALFEEQQKRQEEDQKKKGDWETLLAQREEKLRRQIEEGRAQSERTIAALEQELNQSRLQADLQTTLREIKVHPLYLDGAEGILLRHARVEKGDDGTRQTVVETDDGPKPLLEWAKTWAETDKGQAYIKGPDTSGGGAATFHGANGAGNPWKSGDKVAQYQMIKENRDKARALAKAAGENPAW